MAVNNATGSTAFGGTLVARAGVWDAGAMSALVAFVGYGAGGGGFGRLVETVGSTVLTGPWSLNVSATAIEFGSHVWATTRGIWNTPSTVTNEVAFAVAYAPGATPRMWVNGASVTPNVSSGLAGAYTPRAPFQSTVVIGNRAALDRHFDGRIRTLAVWNRSLTNEEMRTAMLWGAQAVPFGLQIFMPFLRGTNLWRNYAPGATEAAKPVSTYRGAFSATDALAGSTSLAWRHGVRARRAWNVRTSAQPFPGRILRPVSDVSVAGWGVG